MKATSPACISNPPPRVIVCLCTLRWITCSLFVCRYGGLFFFTRWNVVIKKRGKEGSSKKYVLYICFTHKFHLFRLIGKCHEIFIRYNDYSIDPSIVRIAFYLFFSSYLTKIVIFCKFFYIYFMLYINFILSLKSNTVSKFKQLIKR